jgi:hypothetical protein
MKSGGSASATPRSSDPEPLTAVTFIRGVVGKEAELKKELLALAGPTAPSPAA